MLFIIESMKLMNEVTSEFNGTVEKILVQNGQAVEYGQPIMVTAEPILTERWGFYHGSSQ